ncbi:MAG: EAL domain-containing protein, partial [Culicoidibacterales bacterium]
GDLLLLELISTIEKQATLQCPITVCQYENDSIMMMIGTTVETQVIAIIEAIVSSQYQYNVQFRVGYQKLGVERKVEDFLDSILYIMKYPKYQVKAAIDDRFELTMDIARYTAIKQAMNERDGRHLQLMYQPKINNKTKIIHSCEILSRWHNPELGMIMPYEFLPIVKNLHQEIVFDALVFEEACKQFSNEMGSQQHFSVNISVKAISDDEFVADLMVMANKHQILPQRVTLEIVEDICTFNFDKIVQNIDALVKLGFLISIDDFGTGYSSYSRLAELNFSEVKIPREFLLLEEKISLSKNKKILSGIVNVCKALNCKIVIEGAETQANIELAEELEIDYVQGYF